MPTNQSAPMHDKTCVITGGSAGIGYVTARELARGGARVIIAARDARRGEAAAADIRAATGNGAVEFIAADLSLTAGVRDLAASVRAEAPRLDVLINNAGAMFGKRRENADGIEKTFALNHLAYFALSLELLPALRTAAPARIVNVASQAHKGETLDPADLQMKRKYDGWRAYKRSKLANILFTRSLARRLEGSGVTANALHPGFVATDIGIANAYVPKPLWRLLTTLFAINPEEGAKTSLHAATAAEVKGANGRYFAKCAEATPDAPARDDEMAETLWAKSEEMTGIRLN